MLLTIITSKYIQESEPFVKRLFGSLIQQNGPVGEDNIMSISGCTIYM